MKVNACWRPVWAAGLLAAGLCACEIPENSIGSELQPEEDLIEVIRTDTFTVALTTVREDSIKTDELSLSLLGNALSPIFGQTHASVYTQFRLATNNVNFGDPSTIIIDSLVLNLILDQGYFGQLEEMGFEIKELSEPLYLDSGYYSNRKIPITGPNLIARKHLRQTPDPEALRVVDEEERPALMSFLLNNSLAQRLVNASGTEDLANNDNFSNFFKGIRLTTTDLESPIVAFNLADSESRMLLYYKEALGAEQETFAFNITSETPRFSAFDHGYQGTPMSGLVAGIDASITGFIKTASGSKLEIHFPTIVGLNSFDNRTVNKAEIFLPLSDLNPPRTSRPERLFVLRKASDGTFLGIADQALGIDHADGTYDATVNAYRLNISRHVQQVLNGTIENTPLFIVAGNSAVTAMGLVINGPFAFPEVNDKNTRLEVTFSH